MVEPLQTSRDSSQYSPPCHGHLDKIGCFAQSHLSKEIPAPLSNKRTSFSTVPSDAENTRIVAHHILSPPHYPSPLSLNTIAHPQIPSKEMLQETLGEIIGPYTLEVSNHPASLLPENSVEVHFERPSSSEIAIAIRTAHDEPSITYIVFDLIKMGVKHEEIDKVFRNIQQKYMIYHMEKVAENLLNQSKMLLYSGIATGVLGISGGLLPIVGLWKGDSILRKLSSCRCFNSLQGVSQAKVFLPLSRAFAASSTTAEISGRVNTTQADGIKTRDECKSRVFETAERESTRMIEDKVRRKDFYINLLERIFDKISQVTHTIATS